MTDGRERTGWICVGCNHGSAPCIEITTNADALKGCLRHLMGDLVADYSAWKPFYGSITED